MWRRCWTSWRRASAALKGLVRNDRGEVHDHVNIYVNNEGIESLQGLATPLKDGDEVSIIPALAGGSSTPA
jgi:molybdopterin synthase sulfur carrier subunit